MNTTDRALRETQVAEFILKHAQSDSPVIREAVRHLTAISESNLVLLQQFKTASPRLLCPICEAPVKLLTEPQGTGAKVGLARIKLAPEYKKAWETTAAKCRASEIPLTEQEEFFIQAILAQLDQDQELTRPQADRFVEILNRVAV